MKKFSVLVAAMLSNVKGLVSIWTVNETVEISTDNVLFNGVVRSAKGVPMLRVWKNEDKHECIYVQIPDGYKLSATKFLLDLVIAERDAAGDFNGKAWSIAAGETRLKFNLTFNEQTSVKVEQPEAIEA